MWMCLVIYGINGQEVIIYQDKYVSNFRKVQCQLHKICAEVVWVPRAIGGYTTILDHMGPCMTILDHKGPYGTIQNYTGSYMTILDLTGPSGTIGGYVGPKGWNGTIRYDTKQNNTGWYGTICDHIWPYQTTFLWKLLSVSENIIVCLLNGFFLSDFLICKVAHATKNNVERYARPQN